MPGGGFDTGFDVGFDIGTDAALRVPTWFRGASCELRPLNMELQMRAREPAQPRSVGVAQAAGWSAVAARHSAGAQL